MSTKYIGFIVSLLFALVFFSPGTSAQESPLLGRNRLAAAGRRGARPARHEELAYREYVSDELRRRPGWTGGQSG